MKKYPTDILTQDAITKFIKNFSKQKVAIIDLDGTIANSLKPYCRLLREKFNEHGCNINFEPDDNINFDIIKSLEKLYSERKDIRSLLNPEFVYEPFDRTEVFEEAEMIEETELLLKRLGEKNFRIIYATSRPQNVINATKKWIEKYNLPIDGLLFEQRSSSLSTIKPPLFKSNLLAAVGDKVGDKSLFYDDKPQTLVEANSVLNKLKNSGKTVQIQIYGRPTSWNKLPGSTDPYSVEIQHLLKNPLELIQKIS